MIRIANCSGFYGDRLAAAREMVEGGPIDVLTGDYLAELTMLILWKNLQSGRGGYARTFLRQLEDVLGMCVERGIRIVTNAGGLDPAGLADRVREVAERLGVHVRVAHVEGDDLRSRFPDAVTANAYLGCWGIVTALRAGADVVVCPRVTDASLVVGPAAWAHGWERDNWDALAGAVVAGHVLECGTQATGGNYAFFAEVPGLTHPGFPLAEVDADGAATITKHPATGGLVSVGTVTAQLLYELGPAAYANPDVVARFDTVRLEQEGPDRVRISGVRGEPAPLELKVAVNVVGGYRNAMTFLLPGLDVEAKAELLEAALRERLGGVQLDVQLIRSDKEDALTNAEACAQFRVVARGTDAEQVGRAFSGAAIELALASYPGFAVTAPPGDASPYGIYRAAFVPRDAVAETVVLDDGTRIAVEAFPPEAAAAVNHDPPELPPPPAGPTRRVPLGLAFGARAGDKGGDANVGVWARSAAGYAWLERFLDVPRFKQLVVEAEPLTVHRYELPNLLALNFVVEGLLGEGVAASTRFDPQAKTLGEYLRSRHVDLPEALL
jgi:Acyclic terpene utilisation family protein AtuA